ncbi:MAG: chloride channel protein [Calditrichaeota bacterium]|nr:chloride channel protein [Calditrichota bacterium]MCB9090837.1 chloride channel protein [Calditrichia bacterium]
MHLQQWYRKLKLTFLRYFVQFRATEHVFMISLAVLIGLVGGFGAVSIQWMIRGVQEFLWGVKEFPPEHMRTIPVYMKILIPTIGAILVGAMVYYFSRESKGHGVPEVMSAIALRNGVIRPRVAVVKLLSSSLYIGSGGSVGREGPVIQIGASVGSALGQFLRVNPQRLKIFVACGAAAGIAAAFNAPIAGALFAVEVILGDFAVAQFSPIVISSVVATVVSRSLVGDFPAFQVPSYSLVSPIELLFYGVLGLLAGLAALAYTKTLYAFEDFFDELKMHDILKTGIGGMLIGFLGIWVPQIFGVGYHAMDSALHGSMESPFGPGTLWMFMLILVFIKILATSISLGSGGSGGVFAPSLFVGTMCGGFFGEVVHLFFPAVSANPGAYALVGMGAVVAGTTHAPITAILIIFEMTKDYKIILPLMITCVIATLLTMKLQKESIYTLKLVRRGIDLYRGREINVLRSLPVREVMQNDPVVIDAGTPFAELVKLFLQSRHSEFFVLDNHQRFAGRISLGDVRRLMQEEQYLADIVVAHDLVNPNVATIHPEDSLDQVMRIFGRYAVEELPVVDSLNPDRVIGVVFYKDVIEAYNHELMKRDLLSETGASLKMLEKSQKISFLDGYAMMEIPIPMGFAGKSLHELNLRHRFGVNILMIKRRQAEGGYKQIVPLPHEVLKLDDRLIAMGKEKDLQKLQHA